MGCPGELLYGVNNDGVRDKAAVGITEEPGVDAVDFADKLLILIEKYWLFLVNAPWKQTNKPIIISFPCRAITTRRIICRRTQQMERVWS